jgi:hypothetical protein
MRQIRNALVAAAIVGATALATLSPANAWGGTLGSWSVLGRSGGWGRNRRRRRKRNRITAVLPVWLLRTISAVPRRVEWLRLGAQLLLRPRDGLNEKWVTREATAGRAVCWR